MSTRLDNVDVVEQLRRSLEDLRLEVGDLREQVASHQERLSALEGRTPVDDFEVLPADSAAAASTGTSRAGYCVGSERQGIARDIGIWVRQALQGRRRGLSGRERIAQSSRYYLVFRDFDSVLHDPPRLFHSWIDCKAVVTRHSQPGDSLYIGLPTREESRIVCSSAGVTIPAELIDGRSGRSQ